MINAHACFDLIDVQATTGSNGGGGIDRALEKSKGAVGGRSRGTTRGTPRGTTRGTPRGTTRGMESGRVTFDTTGFASPPSSPALEGRASGLGHTGTLRNTLRNTALRGTGMTIVIFDHCYF